jgi:hypothetical protein
MVRAAWMENIMSNKINLHHTAKNQQERVQLDEAALTESELHNVIVKLPRFGGHPNICVPGVHDVEDETTIHT